MSVVNIRLAAVELGMGKWLDFALSRIPECIVHHIIRMSMPDLIEASRKGYVSVVRVLLAAGTDVHARNDEALCLASNRGHVEVVLALLAAGADIHAEDNEALHLASRYGHVEVVQLLKQYVSE